MYLPMYLGGDDFCRRDGHSSTNLFGRELKFIYLLIFGKGWPLIYPSIEEGMAKNLPIYLGENSNSSIRHVFWQGMYLGENPNLSIHPFCWGENSNSSTLLKVVIQYPSSLEEVTLHVSTFIFGRGWFL